MPCANTSTPTNKQANSCRSNGPINTNGDRWSPSTRRRCTGCSACAPRLALGRSLSVRTTAARARCCNAAQHSKAKQSKAGGGAGMPCHAAQRRKLRCAEAHRSAHRPARCGTCEVVGVGMAWLGLGWRGDSLLRLSLVVQRARIEARPRARREATGWRQRMRRAQGRACARSWQIRCR